MVKFAIAIGLTIKTIIEPISPVIKLIFINFIPYIFASLILFSPIAFPITAMGGLDVIVFTAGIGENADMIREGCLKNLEFLGVYLDKEKNKQNGEIAEISKDDSKVKVFVIPTNEELMIAKETMELLN